MENIKTATRNPHLEQMLPEAAWGYSNTGWFVSQPLETKFHDKQTHYVVVSHNALTGEARVHPVEVLGAAVGEQISVWGCRTPEEALAALGYTITIPLPAPAKSKRTPARTHLNVADIDRETGKPTGRKPACGQLNGTRTDRAQTHYTTDTAQVTCQRCVTTKLFAKAMADEFHAIDRKAWADALENNKEFLEEFEKLQKQQHREIAEVGESFDYSVFAGAQGTLSGPGSVKGGAQ